MGSFCSNIGVEVQPSLLIASMGCREKFSICIEYSLIIVVINF